MKIDSPRSEQPVRVVSPLMLLSCFGICLWSAYLLIPKGEVLYHLLLADGDEDRVIELVVGSDRPTPAQAASRSPEVDEKAGPVDYRKLVRIVFDSVGDGELNPGEVSRITSVLERCDPTSASFANLRRHAPGISDRDNEHFYSVIARRALAEGDPGLAAEIMTDLADRVASLKLETAEMMVRAYRYTGQSMPALTTIERLREQLGGSGELPDDLRQTYVDLLFEVDRAGDAFDVLSGEFEMAEGDAARLGEVMKKMVDAASFSERSSDLPPFYDRYFAALPMAGAPLSDLAEIGRGEIDQEIVSFLEHAKRYAQICEWNDHFERSFDFYLKGAALGDEFSLQRATDLNKGLLRHTDMANLLSELVPVPGRPEHTLELARLLGEEAKYEEAREIYRQYLDGDPGSLEACLELAALEEEGGDLRAAQQQYLAALRLAPDDVQLKIRVAGLHITFGEHQQAFEIYRQLEDHEHDGETLESLQMLAEAHGDYDELNRAMILSFSRLVEPDAESYLDLAQSYSLKGDTVSELRVLSDAVYHRPESQQLAVVFADVLYRENRFDEAVKLLTRPALQSNMQAMSLFIEICGGTDQHAYAAKYLPPKIEESFDFAPSVRIELGQIYEEVGDLSSAQTLYASVPEGGMAWHLLAAAKYKTGEFDRAEEYQRRYLKAAEQVDAQDWVFLGDICKNLGKEREATEAYKHSLNMLKSELKPRNASL